MIRSGNINYTSKTKEGGGAGREGGLQQQSQQQGEIRVGSRRTSRSTDSKKRRDKQPRCLPHDQDADGLGASGRAGSDEHSFAISVRAARANGKTIVQPARGSFLSLGKDWSPT